MRFNRRPRTPYVVTDRKRGAAQRWQQRQRGAMPLLAALIAETQPAIEQIMTERVMRWDRSEQAARDHRAGQWRRGRQLLAMHPAECRTALLRYWNDHRWLPGDPVYLLDLLHSFDTGRLVLIDGQIRAARDSIAAHEAAVSTATRKPVAAGWFGKHR